MEHCEANCIVLRSLLGSCLSDINKLMSLWYYSILSSKEEKDCSLSFLLNLTIDVHLSLLIIKLLSLFEVLLVMEATLVGLCFV